MRCDPKDETERLWNPSGARTCRRKKSHDTSIFAAVSTDLTCIPGQFTHSHPELFNERNSGELPNFELVHHEINTTADPPSKPLYPLSEMQLAMLRTYIDEGLKSGRIRPSRSPAGAPVLFIPKKHSRLLFCVDYKGFNNITIKDQTPLPLIAETLDRF